MATLLHDYIDKLLKHYASYKRLKPTMFECKFKNCLQPFHCFYANVHICRVPTENPDVLAKVMMKKAFAMLDIDENEDPTVVKERIQEQLLEEAEKLGASLSKGKNH
mgnify:FL=1